MHNFKIWINRKCKLWSEHFLAEIILLFGEYSPKSIIDLHHFTSFSYTLLNTIYIIIYLVYAYKSTSLYRLRRTSWIESFLYALNKYVYSWIYILLYISHLCIIPMYTYKYVYNDFWIKLEMYISITQKNTIGNESYSLR